MATPPEGDISGGVHVLACAVVTPAGGGDRHGQAASVRESRVDRGEQGWPSARLRDGAVRCRSRRVRERGDGAGPATIARTGDTIHSAPRHRVAEQLLRACRTNSTGGTRHRATARIQMRQHGGVGGATARCIRLVRRVRCRVCGQRGTRGPSGSGHTRHQRERCDLRLQVGSWDGVLLVVVSLPGWRRRGR